jgi:4-hydroxybenzoyl-CoA reductase subunit beta
MLRLQPFQLCQPRQIEEAISSYFERPDESRYVSGGTDLLPNLKQAYGAPTRLISLGHIDALHAVSCNEDRIRLGAGLKLSQVAKDPNVREHLPALSVALSGIATPQIRNMATLGGNICLDTRCRYINQSELFREALGGCLKSHGDLCHVVPGGQKCVAALSSDSVPVLIAFGAGLEVAGREGVRTLALRDFFCTDGLAHIRLEPGEIVVAVEIPRPAGNTLVGYRKWAVRKCFDFPLVSVALRLELGEDSNALDGGMACIGVLGPKPRIVDLGRFAGRALSLDLADELGQWIWKRSRPLPNVPYDDTYRRRRLGVEVKRLAIEMFEGLEPKPALSSGA